MIKQLKDLTLGEVRDICRKQAFTCEKCPLAKADEWCKLADIPESWKLKKRIKL